MASHNNTPTATSAQAQNKLGMTTVQVHNKRYSFPSVIVKTDADKEGVCVMLDVGLFCPFCAKSYKSKYSHKRSRVAITRAERDKSGSQKSREQADRKRTLTSGSGTGNKLLKPDLSALEKFTDVQSDEISCERDNPSDFLKVEDNDVDVNKDDLGTDSNTKSAQFNFITKSKVVQLKTLSQFQDIYQPSGCEDLNNSQNKDSPVLSPGLHAHNYPATHSQSNTPDGTVTQSRASTSETDCGNISDNKQNEYNYSNAHNETTERTSSGYDNRHDMHYKYANGQRVDLLVTQTDVHDVGSLNVTANPDSAQLCTKGDTDCQTETTDKQCTHKQDGIHINEDQNNSNKICDPPVNNEYLQINVQEGDLESKGHIIITGIKVNELQESNNNVIQVLDTSSDTCTDTAIQQNGDRLVNRAEENGKSDASDEPTSEEESYRDIDEETLRQIELKLIENLAKMEEEERTLAQSTDTATGQLHAQPSACDKLQESIQSLPTDEPSMSSGNIGIPTARDIYEQAMAILGDGSSGDDGVHSSGRDMQDKSKYWQGGSESPELAMEQILDELSNEIEIYSSDATLPRVFSVRGEKWFNQVEFEESENERTSGEQTLIDLKEDGEEHPDNLTLKPCDEQMGSVSDDVEDRSRANTGVTELSQNTDIAASSVNDVLDDEFESAHDLNRSFSDRNSTDSKSLNETRTSMGSSGSCSISARSISKFSSLSGMRPKEPDELFERAFETAMETIEDTNNDWTSDYESETVDSAMSTSRQSHADDDIAILLINDTDDFKLQCARPKQGDPSSAEWAGNENHCLVPEHSYGASMASRGSRGSSCDSSTGSYSFTDDDTPYSPGHMDIPLGQIIEDTQQMTQVIQRESEAASENQTNYEQNTKSPDRDDSALSSDVHVELSTDRLQETLNIQPTHIENQACDEILFHTPTDVCAPLSPTVYPGGVALAKTQKIPLLSSQDDLDRSVSPQEESTGDDVDDQSFDQGEYDLCLNEVFVTKEDIFDPKLNVHVRDAYLLKPSEGAGSSPQTFERKISLDELSESSTLSSIDEFIPEIEQESAPPEVMQQAYQAALEVAKIFQHHHMIHPCFHKIMEESSGSHDEDDDGKYDATDHVDVDASTSVAEFDHEGVLTKDQTKQFLTHMFGAGHSEHKQKRSDLHSCIKEICVSCSEKPEDGAVVKSEEITTQEVTLVFAWPKSKKSQSNPSTKQKAFRELNLRRVIRSNDLEVQVIEGPSIKAIEKSMGKAGSGIPLSPESNVSFSSSLTSPKLSISAAESKLVDDALKSTVQDSVENAISHYKSDSASEATGRENIMADIDVRVTTTHFEPHDTQVVAIRQPEIEAKAVSEITSNILKTLSHQKVVTHVDPQLCDGKEQELRSPRPITSTNHIVSGSVITISGDREHLKENSNDTDKQTDDLSRAKTGLNCEKTPKAITSLSEDEKTSSATSELLAQKPASVVSKQCGNRSLLPPKCDKSCEIVNTGSGEDKYLRVSVPNLDNSRNEMEIKMPSGQRTLATQGGLLSSKQSPGVYNEIHEMLLVDTPFHDTQEDPMSRLATDVLETGDFVTGGRSDNSQFSVNNPHRHLSQPLSAPFLLPNNTHAQMDKTANMSNHNAPNQVGHLPFDSPAAPLSQKNAPSEILSSKRLSDDLSLKLKQINDDLDKMFPPNKMYSSLQDLGSKGNKARSKRLSLSETLLLSAEKQVRKATSEDEITSLIDNCASMMEESIRTSGSFVLADSDTIKTDIPSHGGVRTAKQIQKRTATMTSQPLDTIHEGLMNLRETQQVSNVATTVTLAGESRPRKPPPTKPKPRLSNFRGEASQKSEDETLKSPPPVKPKPKLITQPEAASQKYTEVKSPPVVSNTEITEATTRLSEELITKKVSSAASSGQSESSRAELDVAPSVAKPPTKPTVPPRQGKASKQIKTTESTVVQCTKSQNEILETRRSSNGNEQVSTGEKHLTMPYTDADNKKMHVATGNTQTASAEIPSAHDRGDVIRQCSVEREDEADVAALRDSLQYKYPKDTRSFINEHTSTSSTGKHESRVIVSSQKVTCFGYEVEVPKTMQINTSKYFPTKSQSEAEKSSNSESKKSPVKDKDQSPAPRSLLQTSRDVFIRDQSKLKSPPSQRRAEVKPDMSESHQSDQKKLVIERYVVNSMDKSLSSNERVHNSAAVLKDASNKTTAEEIFAFPDQRLIDNSAFMKYVDNLVAVIIRESVSTSVLHESFQTALRDLEAELDGLEVTQNGRENAENGLKTPPTQTLPLGGNAGHLITAEEKHLIKQTECAPTLTKQLKLTTMCSSTPKIDDTVEFDRPLWEKTQSDPEFMKPKANQLRVDEVNIPRISTSSTLVTGSFYSFGSLSQEIENACTQDSNQNKSASSSTLDELVEINSEILDPPDQTTPKNAEKGGKSSHMVMLSETKKTHGEFGDNTADVLPNGENVVSRDEYGERGEPSGKYGEISTHKESTGELNTHHSHLRTRCGVVIKPGTEEIGQYESRVDAVLDAEQSDSETSVASNTSSPFDEETLAYYTSRGISHPLLKQLSSDSEAYTTDSEIDVTEYKTFVTDALIRSDIDGAEVAQYNRTPSMASSSDVTQCATSEYDDFRDTASEAETDELFVHIPGSDVMHHDSKTIQLLQEETEKLTQSLLSALSPDPSHIEPVKPTTEKAFVSYNTRQIPEALSLPHANTWSDVSHTSSNLVISPANKSPSFSPTTSSAFSVRDDEYAKRSRLLLKKQAEGASGSIENTDNTDQSAVSITTGNSRSTVKPSSERALLGVEEQGLSSDCHTQVFAGNASVSPRQRARATLRRAFSLEYPKRAEHSSPGYVSNTFPNSSLTSKENCRNTESYRQSTSSDTVNNGSQRYRIAEAKIRKLKTGLSLDSASCTEDQSSKTSIVCETGKSMLTSILVRRHSTGSISSNAYPLMGLKVKAKPPMVPRKPPRTSVIKETPV